MSNNKKTMTIYMQADMKLTGFMPYPCFLPTSSLSPTAKELYVLLLNRANLSKHNNFVGEQGRVYVIYTHDQLSQDLAKSKSSVKAALNELCAADLLERKHRGRGLANHLYVKLPPENLIPANSSKSKRKPQNHNEPDPAADFPSIPGSENRPPDSQKSDPDLVGKLTPSKKKEKKDNSHLKRKFRNYSYKEGESL